MTWVKIDDQLHSHPKLQRAWRRQHSSLGLHLLALSHSAAYLTDGLVSEEFVEAQIPRPAERKRAIEALVGAVLWEPQEGAWVIHDYLDYNESREQILSRRRRDSERKPSGIQAPRTRAQTRGPTPTPDLFPQLAS